jgi:CheY-like chemotaxis protein/anti-sigma regulatory factor (Ser/Thr protein kinase)
MEPVVQAASRRVLVVDDDPLFRRIAEAALVEAGYEVVCASDVRSAQAILEAEDPAQIMCVLVDDGLPDCNGIELVEWLNRRHPSLAAVMVTASPEYVLLERGLQARVCAFLGEPLDPADIRRAVAGAADVTSKRRAFAEMRQQVERVGKLQKALLQWMLVSGDVSLDYRFHPRHDGSGDFLAYHRLPGGQDVLVMSDAAGHDLNALAYSAYFHGMLSGMLRSRRTLPEALEACNRVFWDVPAEPVLSVSVSALEVERHSGCLKAWNYGGPPPVFVDWQGWVQTMGARASSPLGWFEDPKPTLDHVGIPPSPVWMWTDGLEALAESLNASPLSLACCLLEAPAGEPPQFVSQAQDDVLVARIWPGMPANALPPRYAQPLIAEEYGLEIIDEIDHVQERWVRSLQLALPMLSESVVYDLVLCAREAVLNALQHGCSGHGKGRFQVLYDSSNELLRARIWDPGSGYDFDAVRPPADDWGDAGSDHRGLLLMQAHAGRVSFERRGAEVTMEFPICAANQEKGSR